MKKVSIWKVILAAGLFLGIHSVQAALPPWAAADRKLGNMTHAKAMRAASPDVVRFDVTDVQVDKQDQDRCPSVESWTITGVVNEVVRGALAKGDTIEIAYTVERYFCPGPQRQYPRSPEESAVSIGYLQCDDRHCGLAAGVWSFDEEGDFAKEMNETAEENEYWRRQR